MRTRIGSVRGPALLVAADASYAIHAYQRAALHYADFVQAYPGAPEASRAALAIGWSELRAGQIERARQAWMQAAARFPSDARAPLALALAAEVGRRTGDSSAEQLVLTHYPTSPYAGVARLHRSIDRLRAQHEEAAVRHLDEAIRDHGTLVIEERRRLADAIATAGAPAVEHPVSGRTAGSESSEVVERAAFMIDRRDGDSGPYLLHSLVLLSATNHGWAHPLTFTMTRRLADAFPSYAASPNLVWRVGTSAGSAGQWQVARQAYDALVARYPTMPIARAARVQLGEALWRTGAVDEARRTLEKAAAGGGDEAARALMLLADLHEAANDRVAALAAYDRLTRQHPGAARTSKSLLAHADLLEHFKQGGRARSVLQRAVAVAQGDELAEAAYRLGRSLRSDGQDGAALEWFMTAAYAAPGTRWAHHAMLEAATSLSARGEKRQALALYLQLVAKDGDTRGEAAYRAAEIYDVSGAHDDALKLYMTSARLTAGSPAETQALAAAARIMSATGDRAGAEALYQRIQQSPGAKNGAAGNEVTTPRQVRQWTPVTDAPAASPASEGSR